MEHNIQECLDLLELYEKEVLLFLSNFFDEVEVEYLVEEFPNNPSEFTSKTATNGFKAIVGLYLLRTLKDKVKVLTGTDKISTEYSIQLIIQSFRAAVCCCRPMSDFNEKILEVFYESQPKAISKKATNARYENLREFKEKAANVAKIEWENGSILLHNKMAQFLENEYKDENGKHPFMYLPPFKDRRTGNMIKDAPPNKVLLQITKRVAKEMNRPDLISGQKKSK
jgi:hypothetical protein